MPQLKARGAELVVELLEAADHVGHLLPDEIVALLRETAGILDGLLDSDTPTEEGDRRFYLGLRIRVGSNLHNISRT